MKFAHMADCHVGGWSEPKLRELGVESFKLAIESCLRERVDFLLISGDLFNTALPGIEVVKEVTGELKKLNDAGVNVYVIPGSHDFSPSGKTMLDVLEKAGLCMNVFRVCDGKLMMTKDKSGAGITGIIGLTAGLDREFYKNLDFSDVNNYKGYKIFMFHTTIEEFKPKGMENIEGESLSSLPKGFDYYAGGHVHYLFDREVGNGLLVYPGPVFPNNFKELEELEYGRLCIIENGRVERITLKLKEVNSYFFDVNNKLAKEVEGEVLEKVKHFQDKIVMLRLEGVLREGGLNDIDFKSIFNELKDAYCVLKNTSKVLSREFEEVSAEEGDVEDIEAKVIKEHIGQAGVEFDEKEAIEMLIKILDDEKLEGERVSDFEARIEKNVVKALKLERLWI